MTNIIETPTVEWEVYIHPGITRPNASRLPAFNEWNEGAVPLTRNCHSFLSNAVPTPETATLPEGLYKVSIPKPGTTSGNPMRAITIDEFRRAMTSDGASFLQDKPMNFKGEREGHYLGATFVAAGADYHCLRLHQGIWYQKTDCETPLKNRDHNWNIIYNLDEASIFSGEYKYEFAGFCWIKNEGLGLDITVRPVFPNKSAAKNISARPS